MLVAADEGNTSSAVSSVTSCGWSKMTILEDEDDRMRYQHNERHLGSDPKYVEILVAELILY